MPMKYKHDEGYAPYQMLDLRPEFDRVKAVLLLDDERRDFELFDVVDEIYHWFCVKNQEVEKLLAEFERFRRNGPVNF